MTRGQILLIEDEKRLRSNVQMLLTAEGYTVSTAADGDEGMRCLQQQPYDVVITDVMMEGSNGFQVMEYIATHCPETLVIVMTGYASTESATEALRRGAYDYLAKPFEVEMLLFSLERALEKVQLQRAVQRHTEELEQRVAERTQILAETNQQLQRALAEQQAMQEQLIQSEKLSALGELLSGFAHEINNTLTAVVGYAELLGGEEGCPPDMCMMLERICQEAARCHHIVQNLLSFARRQQPEKSYADVTTLCLKTLDLLAYQFRVQNITTVTHFATSLPWTMLDTHQIQQVFVNLLSNAYQAMAEQAGPGQLTLTTAHDAEWISITVTDTGPGIAPDNLRRIFDPFFTTKPQGTGLGLSLTYGFVKEHGGEISASSTPGVGTAFTVRLPILPDPDLEVALVPAVDLPPPSPKHILVIDDEPHVAQVIKAILQGLGHRATAMASGQEACATIAAALPELPYDLVICDMKMPGMHGPQVYRWLQEHAPTALPRLVFTTGDTVGNDNHQFFLETGCAFLGKPFLRADLIACIPAALQRQELQDHVYA